MATSYTDADVAVARALRADIEEQGGFTRPYGEFRKRLAVAGISVSSTACSQLWRAAAEELVTTDEDQGGEEEVGAKTEGHDIHPEEEDPGLSLAEIMEPYYRPIQDDETLDDYEERLSQGLASVRRSEYEVAEKQMLQVLKQGHFYLEMKQLGLNVSL